MHYRKVIGEPASGYEWDVTEWVAEVPDLDWGAGPWPLLGSLDAPVLTRAKERS